MELQLNVIVGYKIAKLLHNIPHLYNGNLRLSRVLLFHDLLFCHICSLPLSPLSFVLSFF